MISIKNISKTYRPKKGVPVTALDDVSLDFEDKGMIFILGKSGSGKSTLLNVLGGLDSYDSGEFIIQGKSSNDFSQANFDSYRNTLIGFIFQEYNILNEFTVGANIALAMQLQGKKASNEELNTILDEVDLTGYANRRPNELSGGQKQRVAIARALIKEPRIIMADEPTGALDSNTGRQVFDTLKKLSKDKLVIIVSHDREFAEYYGDRVIELADGKVISDISKYTADAVSKTDGINVIDNKILHIKKGYKLTDKDVALINEYLEHSEVDSLLSLDERTNNNFKQIAMIDDDGNKKSFKDTENIDENAVGEVKEEIKLIKSRMPYKNSLKMGASGLKNKKFRLVATIILSVFAFSLFGLADTFASYKENRVIVQSIIDSNITDLVLSKDVKLSEDSTYYSKGKFVDADIDKIKNETGVELAGVISNQMDLRGHFKTTMQNTSYYHSTIAFATSLNNSMIDTMGYGLKGELPKADDEIAITKYFYEQFALCGYQFMDTSYSKEELDTEEKFLAKDIKLLTMDNSQQYKVVGIIDTHFDKEGRFQPLLTDPDNEKNRILSYELSSEVGSAPVGVGFYSQNVFNKMANAHQPLGLDAYGNGYNYNVYDMEYQPYRIYTLQTVKDNFYTNVTSLGSDKMLINVNQAIEELSRKAPDTALPSPLTINHYEYDGSTRRFVTLHNTVLNTISDLGSGTNIDGTIKQHLLLQTTLPEAIASKVISYYSEKGITVQTEDINKALVAAYDSILSYSEISELCPQLKVNTLKCQLVEGIDFGSLLLPNGTELVFNTYSGNEEVRRKVTIAGVYACNDSISEGTYTSSLVVPDEFYNLGATIHDKFNGTYEYLFGAMPTGVTELTKFVESVYEDIDGTRYTISNKVTNTVENFGDIIRTLADIFVYIGLGLAVFAALLLMNFISTSISFKKRDIGILRAVGARGSDVFGIFFNESAIIAGINCVLSVIGTFGVCIGLNVMFRNTLGLPLTLLNVGIRQIALILGVSFLTAFIGSILPVMNIARKRPIDAIQNR